MFSIFLTEHSKRVIVIIAVVFFVVLAIFFMIKEQTQIQPVAPTPTVTLQPQRIHVVTKNYNKYMQSLQNPTPLVQSDSDIKQTLAKQAQNNNGTVTSQPTFIIQYEPSVELFEVEIATTDIQKGESDATQWLKNQGLSQAGICNLPVAFSLTPEISNALRGKTITMDEVPNGCQ